MFFLAVRDPLVNTINKIYYDYLLAFTNHKYYIENLHGVICMCYIVQLEIGITTYLQFINITETMYIHMSIDYTINIRGKEQIILNNQQSLCQLWRIWDKGNVLQYLGAITCYKCVLSLKLYISPVSPCICR